MSEYEPTSIPKIRPDEPVYIFEEPKRNSHVDELIALVPDCINNRFDHKLMEIEKAFQDQLATETAHLPLEEADIQRATAWQHYTNIVNKALNANPERRREIENKAVGLNTINDYMPTPLESTIVDIAPPTVPIPVVEQENRAVNDAFKVIIDNAYTEEQRAKLSALAAPHSHERLENISAPLITTAVVKPRGVSPDQRFKPMDTSPYDIIDVPSATLTQDFTIPTTEQLRRPPVPPEWYDEQPIPTVEMEAQNETRAGRFMRAIGSTATRLSRLAEKVMPEKLPLRKLSKLLALGACAVMASSPIIPHADAPRNTPTLDTAYNTPPASTSLHETPPRTSDALPNTHAKQSKKLAHTT